MAEKSTTDHVDLNEVLKNITDAAKQTYKNAEGETFSNIHASTLQKWMIAITGALAQGKSSALVSNALKTAQAAVQDLEKSLNNKDKLMKKLEVELADSEKEYDSLLEKNNKNVNDAKTRIEKAKNEKNEAILAKNATVEALAKVEASLKQPEAKFSPDAAKALTEEAAALRNDLAEAAAQIGIANAELSKANANVDFLNKENARARGSVEDHKAELATFKKKLAAAHQSNVELFDLEEVNEDKLKAVFGARGLEKLKEVLKVGTWDVRGRIQKLTGFFATMANRSKLMYSGYMEVVSKAFDLLKTSSTTWVSVLAPWVNGMVKDIVMMKVHPVKDYRVSLQKRIEAVSAFPKAPIKEKLGASRAAVPEQTWTDVAQNRAAAAKEQASRFTTWIASFKDTCSKLVSYAKSMLAVTGTYLSRVLKQTQKHFLGFCRGVKELFVGSYSRRVKAMKIIDPEDSDSDGAEPIEMRDLPPDPVD